MKFKWICIMVARKPNRKYSHLTKSKSPQTWNTFSINLSLITFQTSRSLDFPFGRHDDAVIVFPAKLRLKKRKQMNHSSHTEFKLASVISPESKTKTLTNNLLFPVRSCEHTPRCGFMQNAPTAWLEQNLF